MDTLGDRLRLLRLKMGLKQNEVAEAIGVTKQNLYKYEKNIITNVPSDKIEALAKLYDSTPAYIMGWEDETGKAKQPLHLQDRHTTAVRIPVLGDVAAGIPISAIEDIIDWEEITEQLASTGEFFGLRIQGDSMAPRICDGDVVIVRQQSDAETGDIVIVRVDHERATCKRLRKYADGAVELISLNPSYEPMFFAKEELDDDYVVIVGVVVELRGKL